MDCIARLIQARSSLRLADNNQPPSNYTMSVIVRGLMIRQICSGLIVMACGDLGISRSNSVAQRAFRERHRPHFQS